MRLRCILTPEMSSDSEGKSELSYSHLFTPVCSSQVLYSLCNTSADHPLLYFPPFTESWLIVYMENKPFLPVVRQTTQLCVSRNSIENISHIEVVD